MRQDKKTLLYKVACKEINRMKRMPSDEMRLEVSLWFNDGEIATESDEEVLSDYIEDYMRWQEDKSIDKLQEILKS